MGVKESITECNFSECMKNHCVAVVQKIWPGERGVGGSERATQRFTEALSQNGDLEIKVLTCGEFYRGMPVPQDYQLPDWELKGPGLDILAIPSVPEIADMIVKNRDSISLLQVGWGFEHYPKSLEQVLSLNIPTVLRTCETGHFTQLMQEIPPEGRESFKKILLGKINKIVAISTLLAKEAKDFGFREDQITVIYSSVPTEIFAPIPQEQRMCLRESLSLPEQGTVFLFAGRLVEAKGIDLLLNAWNLLQSDEAFQKENPFLVILGGLTKNDPAASLVQGAMEHKSRNISFRGVITDQTLVAQYFKVADAFAYPSFHNEGLALAVVEACSSGLPVITSHWVATQTGMSDLIQENQTGLTFPKRTASSLAEQIHRAALDREMTKTIGINARNHTLSLGVDNNVANERYRAVYYELMKNAGACVVTCA